jgi:hypothetical protein
VKRKRRRRKIVRVIRAMSAGFAVLPDYAELFNRAVVEATQAMQRFARVISAFAPSADEDGAEAHQ